MRVWHTCWNTKCYIHLNNMKTYQTKYQWGILYSVRLFFGVVARRNDSLKAIMLFLTPNHPHNPPHKHTYLFFRKVLCVSSVGNNSNWTLKTLPFSSLSLEIDFIKDFLFVKKNLKLSQDVVLFYYKDIRICWLLKLKERKQENNNNNNKKMKSIKSNI